MRLMLYFHTVRYLKWIQLYYQIYYRMRRYPIVFLRQISQRHWKKSWGAPRIKSAMLSAAGEFICMGERGLISDTGIWNSSNYTKLWLYHLHYFDACQAMNAAENKALIHRYINAWLQANPIEKRGVGWEPYPISLRIVNWVKWFATSDVSIQSDWVASLAQQANVLMQRLEYHILGNHLFANAKALIFVGVFFEGVEADRWLHKGIKILEQEMKAQFLPDGGHFELSPMYHASVLWDVCDLCYLAEVSMHPTLQKQLAQWKAVVVRGLDWLSAMSHPDGEIAFFNDAAFDMAPRLDQLINYARQFKVPPKNAQPIAYSAQYLQDTGYCVVHLPEQGKVMIDVAEVGAAYQPGHAHADTLSFELSLFGQRVLVNSGTSHYTENTERHFQRSTCAHNTVCIDGQDSSQVWGSFRVGQRARPMGFELRQANAHVYVACAHDGYARRIHHREWSFTPGQLKIVDRIQGKYQQAIAYFYLHPDVRVIEQDFNKIICKLRNAQIIEFFWPGAKNINISPSYWYPRFGEKIPNLGIQIVWNTAELETIIRECV